MLKQTWPVFVILAVLALRGSRWAYAGFVLLSLVSFAARVGFHLQPQACELRLDTHLALLSLTNYWHLGLFACFFFLSRAQSRQRGAAEFGRAIGATVVIGALVELAEGISGAGHCRLRDLIPDLAGGLGAAAMVLLWQRAREAWSRHGE